jgi:hypothetical protein
MSQLTRMHFVVTLALGSLLRLKYDKEIGLKKYSKI